MKKKSVGLLTIMALVYGPFAAAQNPPKTAPKNQPPTPVSPAQAAPKKGEFFIPIDQKDPASVITAYFKLSALNRISDASVLLGPIFDMNSIEKITQEMTIFSKMVNNGEISVNLLEIKEQGDWALAIILAKTKNAEGKTNKSISDQYLIKLNNQWRVIPVVLRQSPGFSPFIDSNAIALFNYWSENKENLNKKYLK
jgi:hypothetical protein